MEESPYEQYVHHNPKRPVWVRKDLRGCHRDVCLCWGCGRFTPGRDTNCRIAQDLFRLCVDNELVTPVFECPDFVEGMVLSGLDGDIGGGMPIQAARALLEAIQTGTRYEDALVEFTAKLEHAIKEAERTEDAD